MLKTLSIHNYALIDKLEIDFPEGFTVITGETGAGKSILLGALGLLLGNRADSGVLSDKERKCLVEGSFNINKLDLKSFFEANDLDFEETVILRREIVPSGKSRAFINDTPVNLNVLKELGDQLVDIHSQHETLLLNKASFQLNALDDFIGFSISLDEYRKDFYQYISLTKKLKSLIEQNEQSKRDEDYFKFQFDELESAFLIENEDEDLRKREQFLSHAGEVIQGIGNANKLLTDDEHAVLGKLSEIRDGLKKISPFLAGVNELVDRFQSTIIEIKDIISEINLLENKAEFDPDEMQQVSDRLNILYRLQQKHHAQNLSDLIILKKEYESKLNRIVLLDEEVSKLTLELDRFREILEMKARSLHTEREKSAKIFADAIIGLLTQMGMKDAEFIVEVEVLSDFNENGKTKVGFLFSANKGSEAGEISKIASGGELSRLMLAIKSLITKEHVFPTVIFDEIDAGVSGDIAGKVGNILKKMSVHHQLIAISHLPQIASKALHQKRVYKLTENGSTRSMIETLDLPGRVNEIAKMLSDEKITESAVNTAKELLGV